MILVSLFLAFLKIGAFTFGGGYAMIAIIEAEVSSRGWISPEELVNFIAIAESTPGPIAVNLATFVGQRMAGIPGAVCATVGVVLPSFVIILIVAKCFQKFKNSRIVGGCMSGLRPAVVGLVASALITIGKTVFFPMGFSFGPSFFVSFVLFVICSLLAFRKLHPIAVIALSAVLGIAAGYIFSL